MAVKDWLISGKFPSGELPGHYKNIKTTGYELHCLSAETSWRGLIYIIKHHIIFVLSKFF
jgi:hypothetical protein